VVSIAAGITSAQLERWLGGNLPVVRAMPNTPALLGAGVTGLYATPSVDAQQRAQAEQVLASAGRTVWIEREALMDSVTAVSGSGPAYVFLLAEAMEAAGIAQGLPADAARTLVVQTLLGASRMLDEAGESPAAAPPRDLAERHHPGRDRASRPVVSKRWWTTRCVLRRCVAELSAAND
jgi:pyrroline-5-carboxylate reductase